MAPLSKMEQWIAKDQDIEIANELALKRFNQGEEDSNIKVRLIWGAAGIDRSTASKWDSMKQGELIWDESFDLATPDN